MNGEPSRAARLQEARERELAAADVPGFPEIIRKNVQCRLCALADTHPEVLRQVHDLHALGKGVRALETETRGIWLNHGLEPVTNRCFERHFEGHVMQEDGTNGVLQAAAAAAEAELPEVDSTEYDDMKLILDSVRARFKQISSQPHIDSDNKLDYAVNQIWAKMVSEFRSTVEIMDRMKRTERFHKNLLKANCKRMMQIGSALQGERLMLYIEMLRTRGLHEEADTLQEIIQTELPPLWFRAAETSTNETVGTYRLQ
jgi:hypothetical protein